MDMLDLILRNGSVVFPAERVQRVNVGVKGGKIVGFFDEAATPEAAETIDTSGLHVFPGAIDPHVHLGIINNYLEDFEVETKCAALGGYTTIVNYHRHIDSYLGTIVRMTEAAAAVSTIDFAFSLGLLRRQHWAEFKEVVLETGVTSWKFYTQYEGVIADVFKVQDPLTLNDNDLLETITRFAALSDKLLMCVHCENMDITRPATARLRQRDHFDHTLAEFAETSPGYAEASSLLTAMFLAYVAGAHNLYIVHLSAGASVDVLERSQWLQKETGTVVESSPHYLNLNKHSPCNLLAKVGPPVQSEWDRQRLWEGIGAGYITCYGGDHIPYRSASKKGGSNLWETKMGFGGIGVALPLMLTEGYHKRGLPLEQLAHMMSTGPAKSFGLYPKKGAMLVGSDADFALVDLTQERTVTVDMPEISDGFSVYEGMTLKGWPVTTILRGKQIAARRKVLVGPGFGNYLRREI
jgi:dihydropyrimidinase